MKCLKSIILCVFLVFVSLQIIAQQKGEFTIKSSGVKSDGSLSIESTGEGEGVSMPLEWTNIPEGTRYFALNLWHIPHPTDSSVVKSYWVVYNIPSDINSIPKNAKGFGIVGYNDKDQAGYDPMKSKGPGVKEYNLTIYALSEKLKFNTDKVYRTDLLKAIDGKVLGESTLKYTYETGLVNKSAQQFRDSAERPLTEEQKEKVRFILSNYDAGALTVHDAEAIHAAFRDAGLRMSRAVETVIKEAGFNPDQLKELAPARTRN
ncbi:YbhB/YbcL family Raf kinase inhibitor-like protein [Geofilum sp. OHC36d9]|uniref:YbhB/YbcL family Raf kinase inhibitor-like protein n=1 Tax=Geofilum sp. OHC36d9 TaxID=3458413 RepID=UPI0040332D3C